MHLLHCTASRRCLVLCCYQGILASILLVVCSISLLQVSLYCMHLPFSFTICLFLINLNLSLLWNHHGNSRRHCQRRLYICNLMLKSQMVYLQGPFMPAFSDVLKWKCLNKVLCLLYGSCSSLSQCASCTMKIPKSNSSSSMQDSTVLSKGNAVYLDTKLCKPPLKLLFIPQTLFLIALISCARAQAGGDYVDTSSTALMAKSEEDAFYSVLQAINYEIDWRTLYPEPCGGGGGPQGTSCDEVGGLWHITSLSFGTVYENTPSCGRNASIHTSIVQLTHLKSLSFYRCFTQDNTSIPSELASLKATLKSLTFRDNGALGGGIPATLGGLQNLERLLITGANLEGSIPWELGQLKHLMQLDLSDNKLGGVVPSSLGKGLRHLVVLDLSKNCLIGNIPPSLGSLAKVEKLDISRNMLVGEIPLEMGFLQRLNLMDMSFNQLEGNIPSSFAGLSRLQRLDLSHNNFNGPLPFIVWGSLRHLMSLDLSSGGFEGPIPASFASLESLRSLSLANNRLTGGVPRGFEGLSHLYLLHLSGNNLSGQLPFTSAFVARLGPNLRLSGNKGLCSMLPISKAGVSSNVRICPKSIGEDAHQLTSTSSSFSHLQRRSASPPQPLPNLFLTLLACILSLSMRLHHM